MRVKLPTFLIVGAAKSGTTTLYEVLKQHPQIFLPDLKEPEYFAYDRRVSPVGKPVVTLWAEYAQLFNKPSVATQAGEVSPAYMYFPDVAGKVKRRLGKIKIIALVRNPVDRAYSHFLNDRRGCIEPHATFLEAAFAEMPVIDKVWEVNTLPRPYLRFSRYGEQLERYYNEFGQANVRVFLFEQFVVDPARVVSEICEFLTVDKPRNVLLPKANAGTDVRFYALHKAMHTNSGLSRLGKAVLGCTYWSKLIRWSSSLNKKPIAPLDQGLYKELWEVFEGDIARLEELTGLSCDIWQKKKMKG